MEYPMKKIVILLLFLTVAVSAQKNVLIEVFTNSHCPSCVNGYTALNNFYQSTTQDERYIEIFYHMSYPYNDDPLHQHNSADAKIRDQYYGPFFFTPIGFFDGEQQPGGSYSNWGTALENKLSAEQIFDISLSGSKEDQNFTIRADVTNLTSASYSDLNLNLVIVEDVVYTGRNGISNHGNVMRKIVVVPNSQFEVNASGEKTFSGTVTLNQAWDTSNLSVVAFIQGSDKTVYQVEEIHYSELGTTSVNDGEKPLKFGLRQNYPNPFNPSTTITYSLDKNEFVKLSVFDILGTEVATLVEDEVESGEHTIRFDAAGLSSGIYFYSLTTESKNLTRKMILLR